MLLLFTILPGIFFFLALNPNEKPISLAPRLEGKYAEKILKRWDMAVKLFVIVIFGLMVYYITLPLLGGAYRYVVNNEPLTVVEGSVVNQKSTLFGLVFLVWSFNIKETGQHYQFWYPNMIRSTGEQYLFTILPGTNLVLDSKPL